MNLLEQSMFSVKAATRILQTRGRKDINAREVIMGCPLEVEPNTSTAPQRGFAAGDAGFGSAIGRRKMRGIIQRP